MKRAIVFGSVVFVIAACSAVKGSDAGAKDAAADAGGDAYVDLSTTYACGSLTCNPNEYCIHPCCQTACAGSASGDCPFGTHLDASCPEGCRNDSCTPPPMRCGGNTDPCFGVARTGRDAFCYCG
jgi:hypothetical protein